MAGVPELVQALRGNTCVHPRRGLEHEDYFLVTVVPGTLFYSLFLGKSNIFWKKCKFLAVIFGLLQEFEF